MALTNIGKPFEGIVYYAVEASFGAGIDGGDKYPVSSYVQNVRISTGDMHTPIRGFDSPSVKALLEQTQDAGFHIEYNPQCDDTLIALCANRGSCCTLPSLTFVVGLSTCISDTGEDDNASYFLLKGCKPSTVRIASSHNEPYTITIDYLAKSVDTYNASEATVADGDITSTPSELAGDILQFNVAGLIAKSGGDYVIEKSGVSHLAWITDSIDITIEHQLTSYSDHNSTVRDFVVEGTLDVTGSVDITMDGGGAQHIDEVLHQTEFTITVDLGGAGCPRITLTDCKWDSGEVTGDISGEAIKGSCPFTVKTSTDCSSGITIVSSTPE